jgi:hypothetical protein
MNALPERSWIAEVRAALAAPAPRAASELRPAAVLVPL